MCATQKASSVSGSFNVRMETEFLALPEIVVLSDIGLRARVQRVIDRVPGNYGADKYLINAYHRSYFVSDSAFARLNEAYPTIEDGPYDRDYNTKMWVNQLRSPETGAEIPGRIATFFGRQSLLVGPYEWQSNPMRHPSIWAFGRPASKMLPALTFRQVGEYLYGADTLLRLRYEIDPAADLGEDSWMVPGYDFAEILINKTDLAILEFRWWTKSEGIYNDATYQEINGSITPNGPALTGR